MAKDGSDFDRWLRETKIARRTLTTPESQSNLRWAAPENANDTLAQESSAMTYSSTASCASSSGLPAGATRFTRCGIRLRPLVVSLATRWRLTPSWGTHAMTWPACTVNGSAIIAFGR